MQNVQGSLLVASPHLPDPNFYQSVVLMVEHSEEGALGVILNERVWSHRFRHDAPLRQLRTAIWPGLLFLNPVLTDRS